MNKLKSLLIAAAVAAAFLVLPASKASAQVAFQAQVNTPIGTFGVGNAPAPYYGPPAPYYAPPYPAYAPYAYPYGYPYPVTRVWVVAPYPHWVYRRAYYGHSYGHAYAQYGHSYHHH
ncbi:MAG TPA: hypothetical protein VH854_11760 [Thermoanaerobaculia bacterium]|nr:hypothetical protein [Thermoanaerobaculia bacterium]